MSSNLRNAITKAQIFVNHCTLTYDDQVVNRLKIFGTQ